MDERRYIIHPSDATHDWRIAKRALEGLRHAAREARREQKAKEVVIRDFRPPRTRAQQNTLWMWHGQVASELTLRTGRRWTKASVHEVVFLPRWMPVIELYDLEGKRISRPMRTSDEPPEGEERSVKQIISDAMNEYLAWIYDMGIVVTVPADGW